MLAQRCHLSAFLGALIAAALFPVGWITERWPAADSWLVSLFPGKHGHMIGHATIFVMIGAALLMIWPALLRRPARYLSLIFALAVAQELFQRSYKGFRLSGDDLFDLWIDLLAAAVVFALASLSGLWARRAAGAQP